MTEDNLAGSLETMDEELLEEKEELTIDLKPLIEKVQEELAKHLAEKLSDKASEYIARRKLDDILYPILEGNLRILFISQLALHIASKLAEELAKEIEIEIGKKLVLRLGDAKIEIDAYEILNMIKIRLEAILRAKLDELLREAVREHLG